MAKVFRDYLRDAQHFFTAPTGVESKGTPPLELKASDAMRATYAVQAGIPQYPPREYRMLLSAYRTNPIVRNATRACAKAVAAIEPLIKVDGREDHPDALFIAEWLKRPNPGQDRRAYLRDLAAYYKLAGNGWSEFVAGMTSRYYEAYVLRPERMRVIPGSNGWPAGYEYDSSTGRKVRWAADFEGEKSKLLHIKDFSTDNDHFGAGALEAAEGALALYNNAQALARHMFESGLMMSGILTYEPQVPSGQTAPPLTPEQREALKKQLDEFRKGGKRAGGVGIFSSALKFTPTATTMVDLQAEEIRNQAKRDIALAFEVPPMLLGIPGDNTYSNYQEASRAFYRSTVINDTQVIFDALARWLSQNMGVQRLEIGFDEDDLWPLADELAQRAARVEGSQVLSYQEKREAIGYDPEPPPGQLPSFMNDLGAMLSADLGLTGRARVVDAESEPVSDRKRLPKE